MARLSMEDSAFVIAKRIQRKLNKDQSDYEYGTYSYHEIIGMLAMLWHNSQTEFATSGDAADIQSWIGLDWTKAGLSELINILISVGVLRLDTHSTHKTYSIVGNDKHIAKLMTLRRNAAFGGKASGVTRRNNTNNNQKEIEANASKKSKRTLEDYSILYNTIQYRENKNICTVDKSPVRINSDKLNQIYKLYPKRSGNQRKSEAMKRLSKLFPASLSSVERQARFEKLQQAARNYAQHCRNEEIEGTKFVMMFSTWVNGPWEEWVDRSDVMKSKIPQTLAEIKNEIQKNKSKKENEEYENAR